MGNKSRLEKIKARQEVLGKISDEAKGVLKNKGTDAALIIKLIVQGALMLLEDKITVQCRQADVGAVQGCLGQASSMYSQVIQKESGASKTVSFQLDSQFLPATSLGGVVLSCNNGDIKIDNTLD